jgi:hypothetical protein
MGSSTPDDRTDDSFDSKADNEYKGQRDQAMKVLEEERNHDDKNPNMAEVMATGLKPFVDSLDTVGLGEFQSGDEEKGIGHHYDSIREDLKKDATADMIKDVATKETEFWRSKDDSSTGAMVPSSTRECVLTKASEKLKK